MWVALNRVPLQVLGREGPFPLILLPQFGGYWIEGTNHEITSIPETEPLQSPTTKVKLECNPTARIYRKHFLGKVGAVRRWILGPPSSRYRGLGLGGREPSGWGWVTVPELESQGACIVDALIHSTNIDCEKQSDGVRVHSRDTTRVCVLAVPLTARAIRPVT